MDTIFDEDENSSGCWESSVELLRLEREHVFTDTVLSDVDNDISTCVMWTHRKPKKKGKAHSNFFSA